jgi:hypothetical protein
MNMDLRALDKSKYLKGTDLPANGVIATIGGFSIEQFDEGPKLVINWAAPAGLKPMLCNKTNRQRLMAITGTSNTDLMIGAQVWVYFDQFVEYGGKMVGGIRLKEAPTAPAQAPQTAVQAPQAPISPTPVPQQRPPANDVQAALARAKTSQSQRAKIEQEWAGLNAPPSDDEVPF